MGRDGAEERYGVNRPAVPEPDLVARESAGRLLMEAGRGDTDAFRRFYELTFDDLTRYVSSRVKPSDVDDMVAETYLRAFSSADSFRNQGRPALAWLVTIARNRIATHHYETGRRLRPSADERGIPSVEEQSINAEEHREVLDNLAKLSPRHREILQLRFIDNLPVPVCALELDMSEGAVRAITFRALSALRRLDRSPVATAPRVAQEGT